MIKEAINMASRPNLVKLPLNKELATTTNTKIKISKLARSIKKTDIGDIKMQNIMKFSKPESAPNLRCKKTSAVIIKSKNRSPMIST